MQSFLASATSITLLSVSTDRGLFLLTSTEIYKERSTEYFGYQLDTQVDETQNEASHSTWNPFIQSSACSIVTGFGYCNMHWLNIAKNVVLIIFAVSVLSVTLQSDVKKYIHKSIPCYSLRH